MSFYLTILVLCSSWHTFGSKHSPASVDYVHRGFFLGQKILSCSSEVRHKTANNLSRKWYPIWENDPGPWSRSSDRLDIQLTEHITWTEHRNKERSHENQTHGHSYTGKLRHTHTACGGPGPNEIPSPVAFQSLKLIARFLSSSSFAWLSSVLHF